MTYLVEVTAVQSAVREYLVHESSEIAQHVEQIIAAVPPALAAAVPADLAEAGKVLEKAQRTADDHSQMLAKQGFRPSRGHMEDSRNLLRQFCKIVPALLARIAAQEAQMKGLTKERDELRDMLERSQHVVPDLYTKWHEKAASLLKGSDHE